MLLEQSNLVGSGFMSVTPSPSLYTSLPTDQYQLGLKWWLGLSLVSSSSSGQPYCPGCNATVDSLGDHLVCCIRNNYTKRHAIVQDALASLLAECGQTFSKEVALPGAPADLRPADILLAGWEAGKDVAVDLTVSHGWQAALAEGSISRERWRRFLLTKEGDKHRKYDTPCRLARWGFIPMAFGSWGGQGPEAAKLLSRIVKKAVLGQELHLQARRKHELYASFGLSLMRGTFELLASKSFVR